MVRVSTLNPAFCRRQSKRNKKLESSQLHAVNRHTQLDALPAIGEIACKRLSIVAGFKPQFCTVPIKSNQSTFRFDALAQALHTGATPPSLSLAGVRMKSFYAQSICAVLVVNLVLTQIANAKQFQTGPCSVTVPGSVLVNTVRCYDMGRGLIPHPSDCQCGGRVDIQVQQKAYQGSSSIPCTPISNNLIVSYPSNTAQCAQFLVLPPFWTCTGSNCSQSLINSWSTPGGSDC